MRIMPNVINFKMYFYKVDKLMMAVLLKIRPSLVKLKI